VRVVPTSRGFGPPKGWAEALFASWGHELGPAASVQGSVFGFTRDQVRVTDRPSAGCIHAMHNFGALYGDGLDVWHIVVRGEHMGAFDVAVDYGQQEVRLWGDLPELDALVRQWAAS